MNPTEFANAKELPPFDAEPAAQLQVLPKPEQVNVAMTADRLEIALADESKKRALMKKFIVSNLIEGTDWGKIKIGGRDSKPCLFKSGSEKICSLLHLKPLFSIDKELLPIVGEGVIPYLCRLVNRHTGEVEGEGRGSCSIKEKQGNVNVAIKIAEKRAQLDACLRVAALSDQFTQDLDDMGESDSPAKADVPPKSYADRPRPQPKTPAAPPVITQTVSLEERCRSGMKQLDFVDEEMTLALSAHAGKLDVLYRNLSELYKAKSKDPASWEQTKGAFLLLCTPEAGAK